MKSFSGVLLKPLDQQADRDGFLIDPAGVTFDPGAWMPIWSDFKYNVPGDVLGHGRVSRETDGSLMVHGELTVDLPESPLKLAIGAKVTDHDNKVARACRLVEVSFVTEHQDPTQPPIVIGATIKREHGDNDARQAVRS